MICSVCGKTASRIYCDKDGDKCPDCHERLKNESITNRLEDVKQASDFEEWNSRDLSEAFWIHFIEYQKRPNKHSLAVINRAIAWAAHADHGLSNSFNHAVRWSGLKLYEESKREDIPEK